jgi:hypothetical protein
METAMRAGKGNRHPWIVLCLELALVAILDVSRPAAQTFSSGSDGSDGALTLGDFAGDILFDPRDSARWGRVLDADGDGVYNFTTITIGFGTRLRLRGDKVNRPVHWLASGDVVIAGVIDLNGEHGVATNDLSLRRVAAIPGSGGYAGGLGGRSTEPAVPSTPGEGPGGGSGGQANTANCPYGLDAICGNSGVFTGNRYLIPLVGGAGGEGARWNDGNFYNGGAGGGAILIVSSTSIAINFGGIVADGGSNVATNVIGAGSGGAIRLVAPVLSGAGTLSANGGASANPSGPGWIRLEGFQISPSFQFPGGTIRVTRGAPIDPTSFRPFSGSVRVTSVGGVAVPPNPSGSFELPDVTLNTNTPVSVDIQASGIPPGTMVTLRVFPEIADDPTAGYLPEVQAMLQGTLESSTASVSVTFPYGFSRGYVRATWTQ